MRLTLDKRFKQTMNATFAKYDMRVGILDDGPHRDAKPAKTGLGSYAGGPVRKKGKSTGTTISEVAENIRQEQGVEWLEEPFRDRTADIIKFSNEFFKMASGAQGSMRKRCENLLQAIVRNPILRGDYGSNSSQAKKWKTFDRYLMDTAQFFRAIKAKITVRGGPR